MLYTGMSIYLLFNPLCQSPHNDTFVGWNQKCLDQSISANLQTLAGLIIDVKVTPSLIGWAQTLNQPCLIWCTYNLALCWYFNVTMSIWNGLERGRCAKLYCSYTVSYTWHGNMCWLPMSEIYFIHNIPVPTRSSNRFLWPDDTV